MEDNLASAQIYLYGSQVLLLIAYLYYFISVKHNSSLRPGPFVWSVLFLMQFISLIILSSAYNLIFKSVDIRILFIFVSTILLTLVSLLNLIMAVFRSKNIKMRILQILAGIILLSIPFASEYLFSYRLSYLFEPLVYMIVAAIICYRVYKNKNSEPVWPWFIVSLSLIAQFIASYLFDTVLTTEGGLSRTSISAKTYLLLVSALIIFLVPLIKKFKIDG